MWWYDPHPISLGSSVGMPRDLWVSVRSREQMEYETKPINFEGQKQLKLRDTVDTHLPLPFYAHFWLIFSVLRVGKQCCTAFSHMPQFICVYQEAAEQNSVRLSSSWDVLHICAEGVASYIVQYMPFYPMSVFLFVHWFFLLKMSHASKLIIKYF